MTTESVLPSNESIFRDIQSGRFDSAEAKTKARLDAQPGNVQALSLHGFVLSMLARWAEAAEIHRILADLQPQESAHYNNLGTCLRELGDLNGAEHAYRQGLSLKPDDPGALSSLGSLRWQRGDMVETRELMLAAWQLDPTMPEPKIYGAPACLKCADPEMAARLLEGCEAWPFLGATLEAELGATLVQMDRMDEAERRLRLLLNHADARSIATLRLAAMMERVNRLDEAEALLANASISDVDWREEQSVRATLAYRRGRMDEAVALYRNALGTDAADITSADSMFALAKALDALGETDEAMRILANAHGIQLEHAGRLMPKLLAPDSNPLNIVDYPVAESDYRSWAPDSRAPSVEESPIFIVGFPRSGTTLLEQMLDAHPSIRSMDERAFLQNVITRMQEMDSFLYPDDLGRLSEAQLDELRQTYWNCVKDVIDLKPGERLLDKNPLNVLRLPIIHRIFPNARIILALRHPCDVLLSNYMQCFHAPTYQILCSTLERLATGYAKSMDFWTAHAKFFDAAILELRYEDLVEDMDSQIERIAAHLQLQDPAPLRNFQEHARSKGFISTPSYSQVVEPINRKGMGRWTRYRTWFEPVLPLVSAAMQRWGYQA